MNNSEEVYRYKGKTAFKNEKCGPLCTYDPGKLRDVIKC
jgi:hypothetical protein